MYGLTSSEETAWEPSAPNMSMLDIAAFNSPRTISCEVPAEAAAFLAMCVKMLEKLTFACISKSYAQPCHMHVSALGNSLYLCCR